jgi:hypothetical protein
MARSSSSFKRKKPRFLVQPTVLVICEDSQSAKNYLQDASRYFRVDVQVEITHCGKTDPKGIVTEAIERQTKFENVFCVIDRDSHPSFDEAIRLAKCHDKIKVIASFPCFEFWLLLHFGMAGKPYVAAGVHSAGDMLVKDLCQKEGMEKYAKGGEQKIFDVLLGEKFLLARRLSPRRLAEALEDGNLNPSTALHELIDFLEVLSVPQLRQK